MHAWSLSTVMLAFPLYCQCQNKNRLTSSFNMRLQYAYRFYECAIWHTNRKVYADVHVTESVHFDCKACVSASGWVKLTSPKFVISLFISHQCASLYPVFPEYSSFDVVECVFVCWYSLGYKSLRWLNDEQFSNQHSESRRQNKQDILYRCFSSFAVIFRSSFIYVLCVFVLLSFFFLPINRADDTTLVAFLLLFVARFSSIVCP